MIPPHKGWNTVSTVLVTHTETLRQNTASTTYKPDRRSLPRPPASTTCTTASTTSTSDRHSLPVQELLPANIIRIPSQLRLCMLQESKQGGHVWGDPRSHLALILAAYTGATI